MRGVGDGLFADGLTLGSGERLGIGDRLGRGDGEGDGERKFALRLVGILKFVLIFTALKLKLESNPTFVFRFIFTFGMFVLMLFELAGVSFCSSQNSPAPHARTKIVPRMVNTTILPVFCGGGGGG